MSFTLKPARCSAFANSLSLLLPFSLKIAATGLLLPMNSGILPLNFLGKVKFRGCFL